MVDADRDITVPKHAASPDQTRPRGRLLKAVVREAALVLVLLVLYKLGRGITNDHFSRAFSNARALVQLERQLGMFSELDVQRFFLRSPAIVVWLNRYYLFAHIPVTGAFLVWAFARHRSAYRPIRNVLAVVTFAGLLIHIVYPLAPPRMLPGYGFVDTGQVFGPSAYGGGGLFDAVANQIAAMPSLHFAWALIVAWGIIALAPRAWRTVAIVHSTLTLLAIVITGNHYWMDAIVGLLLGVVALAFFGRLDSGIPAARRLPTTPAGLPGRPSDTLRYQHRRG